MDRAKIAFVVIAVVAVAAAAGLGLAAKGRFDAASEARGERDSARAELKSIYGREVFPSESNVLAVAAAARAFEGSRAALTGELFRSNIALSAPGEMSPSAFQQKLDAGARALRARAPRVDGEPSVSPSFAFGFDAYLGDNPAMPSEEEVPLLVQQLTATVLLVNEVYASEVSRLTLVQRDAQDKATLERRSAAESARGGRRRGRGAAVQQEAPEPKAKARKSSSKPSRGAAPAAPLFESQGMTLEFTARQGALVSLLNRLSAMRRPFVVVTGMSIRKAGPDIRPPSVPSAADGEHAASHRTPRAPRTPRTPRGSRAEHTERAPAPPPPPPPSAADMPPELRVMSGPDIDPPLSVRLELEIYNFIGKEGK